MGKGAPAPCPPSNHTAVILRCSPRSGEPRRMVIGTARGHPSRLALKKGEHLRMTAVDGRSRLVGTLSDACVRPLCSSYAVFSAGPGCLNFLGNWSGQLSEVCPANAVINRSEASP